MKFIETKRGLQTLKKRYLESGIPTTDEFGVDWIQVIDGCLKEGLPMDEIDYYNTPKALRKLWTGLR